MSLKVWLPLLGNLENKGISNYVIENMGGITSNTNGKIGTCMSFQNTANSYLRMPAILSASDNFSIAFWVKHNAVNVNMGYYSQRVATDAQGFTIFYLNGTGIRFDDGTGLQANYIFNTNQWYHVVCCRDSINKYIYINGVLVKTGTRSNTNASKINTNYSLIGGSQGNTAGTPAQDGANHFNGYMNDFRVYNHCLSAAEVKEISQGLVLHYKLDTFPQQNLLLNSNVMQSGNSQSVHILYYYFDFEGNLPTGTYTFSFDIKSSNGIDSCYTSYAKNSSTIQRIASLTNIPTEWTHYSYTFTSTSTTCNDIFFTSYKGYGSPTNSNNTGYIYVQNVKLEVGDKETGYIVANSEGAQPIIQDSSGYNHNGSILNTALLSSDTPRYSASTNLSDANSMINCGRGGMVTDSITVNFWLKSSAWANPVSCTEGGGWNFEQSDTCFRFPVNITDVGYKYGKSTTTKAQLCDNQWHMLTGIYDRINQKIQIYVDGQLDNDYATGTSNTIKYHTSNVIWIGAEATGSNSTASNGMIGLFSDFRIYATALDADAIRQLYQVGAKIDKTQRLHTYEINEDSLSKITKQGQVKMPQFSEHDWSVFLKYDKNIYIEPDGSCWVRIYHHNDPGAGSFSSSNDFIHSIYIDENRWFNVEVCNHINAWELMVKGKFTSTSDEWKLRWIQSVNPMTAAFADVAVANITKITTDGYSSSPAGWGGLWAKKSSAYLTANNGNSGNWWGAVGSYSVYQNGIPGWGPTGTVTTTGFNDLYVRIDNITSSPINTKITSNNMITSNQFIEF